MVELRASGARGANDEAVKGIGIEYFVAVIDAFGANVKGSRLGLLGASGAIAKMRFPGEWLDTMA